MTRILFSLLLIHSSIVSRAQTLGFADFLKSAHTDLTVTGFDRQLDWFGDKRYRLPWVNEMEFRSQNNVLLWGRQQYRVKLDFANPVEVRNNNRYFETQQELKVIRRRLALKEAIKDRYLMASDWITLSERLVLMRDLEALSQQRIDIQEQQSGSASFNPDTYLEARIDLVARQADRQETEYQLAVLQERMAALARMPGKTLTGPMEIIRPETVALLADTLSRRTTVTGIMAQLKNTELAERRIKLDRSRISFGWLQGIYAPYRQGSEKHATGFAVGVTIPLFNRNKNDVARSELSALEENAKLESMKFNLDLSQQERISSLRLQLSQYVNTTALVEQLKKEELEASHLLTRNLDPVSAIRTKVQSMRLLMLQQQIRGRIREEWVMLLDELDLLAQSPMVNFLSEGLETIY